MKNDRSRADFYTLKAQKEGYPARSVYKLKEIDEKFRILAKGQTVADIGAAPGSWSLYACQKTGPSGRVVGIDLKEFQINPTGAVFVGFFGDAFDPKNTEKIAAAGPYDTVLSDAAPATTGNRTVDAGASFEIVEQVVALAETILKKGGNLVVKVFQGGDEKEIFDRMKEMFEIVKSFKPEACRKISFETYFIGKGKK